MYGHLTVFLHVLSAFVWVGGMIAIRFAVHPALASIADPSIKLGKTLEITGRLFHLVIPFILTLLVTGVMMVLQRSGHDVGNANRYLFFAKEGIWTLMTINFVYMYLRRRSAWKLFAEGELPKAKEQVRHIPNLLLPLNILLGMMALYLGISLRGL